MKIKTKLRTHIIKTLTRNRFNHNKALVITSSPRSGSTWLGNLIEKGLPGTIPLFEPLHLREVPEAQAAGFDWHTYRRPADPWPKGYHFLKRVFEGQIINSWTGRDIRLRRMLTAKQVLVKFVRLNRLLPWLTNNFDLLPPVLLVRHPCAVVASMLNTDWGVYSKPQIPPFLDEMPELRQCITNLTLNEEFIAAYWALDLMPALWHPKPWQWVLITYEELVTHPESTLDKIACRWNKSFDMNALKETIAIPSQVVSKNGVQGVEGWKRQLDGDQISAILRVTQQFGFDFYDASTLPVYHPENYNRNGKFIQ